MWQGADTILFHHVILMCHFDHNVFSDDHLLTVMVSTERLGVHASQVCGAGSSSPWTQSGQVDRIPKASNSRQPASKLAPVIIRNEIQH